jgi:hypothetical protein
MAAGGMQGLAGRPASFVQSPFSGMLNIQKLMIQLNGGLGLFCLWTDQKVQYLHSYSQEK